MLVWRCHSIVISGNCFLLRHHTNRLLRWSLTHALREVAIVRVYHILVPPATLLSVTRVAHGLLDDDIGVSYVSTLLPINGLLLLLGLPSGRL